MRDIRKCYSYIQDYLFKERHQENWTLLWSRDCWAVTCRSHVIYHLLEGYFDMEFNLRHQLPSLKTPQCLFSTVLFDQLSEMKLTQSDFITCNFKNNVYLPNSNMHMDLSDLPKKEFFLSKGSPTFISQLNCKNKYNSP